MGLTKAAAKQSEGLMKAAAKQVSLTKVATKIEETQNARKAANGPTANALTRMAIKECAAQQQNEDGGIATFVC